MEPTLLALDTATETLALALIAPGGVRTRSMAGGAAASAQLLPAVLALLADAGVAMRELDAIAFGRGPGAFTGLRTACAVAQGLAFGIGRPVLAIDSLLLVADDALAQQAAPDDSPLVYWVAMDARMDEVYAAAYRREAGRWLSEVAPALYTLPALAESWRQQPPARVAGSAVPAFGARLPLGAAQTIGQERDRGAALARLAREAWARQDGLDPAQALPLYLRDKVALTSAEREQQRAAAA